MDSQRHNTVQSVERALLILETIASYKSISLNEISKAVSLNKATILRLVNTLCLNDYITKDAFTGQYSLTLKAYEIGINAVKNNYNMHLIKSILSEISTTTNELVHFVVEDNNEIITLEMLGNKGNPFSVYSQVGKKAPIYCTASGKALLATYSNEDIISKWHNINIIKYTKNTITDIDQMLQEISSIRKNGFALDNEEGEIGVFCVGVVILNYSSQAIGAISITTNSMAKILDNGYPDLLVNYSNKLSNLLGYK